MRSNELLVADPYSQQFKKAYSLYPSVPKGILEAVAWTQSRFTHLVPQQESCIGYPKTYGVMGLVADGKNYFRNNLTSISQLSGFREEDMIKDPEINIIAYASAFSKLQQQENIFGNQLSAYRSIFIGLSELPVTNDLQNDFALNTHLYQIYWFLGQRDFQVEYSFPNYQIDMKELFGDNYEVLSAGSIRVSEKMITSGTGLNYKNSNASLLVSPDYASAIWNPTSCNYSSRNSTPITAVAIHDVEGSYAGCISWFKNCNANASAHYVLRSSDGQITQMILEADKAWHIGSENPYTVGLEHEGYNNNPVWYTNAMYVSSANLVRDICVDNSINPLRTYYGPGCSGSTSSCGLGACTKVKGHQMFPNQTHNDPGPYWNWDKYYKLINNTYSVVSYTNGSGNFYDSGGPSSNYVDDERRVYLFTKTGATNITLNFTQFDLESGWDHMFIYDGGSIYSSLIGKYSGTVNPGPITSTNDSLLVEFRSDCATTKAGWAASYTTNTSASTNTDVIAPTTMVSTTGAWKTANFVGAYTDSDNNGGSGVEKGYYQVIDFNGNEWRANYTHGFFADNFDNAIHPEWTQKVGTWTVSGNALVQTDETSTVSANTNIYAALTQSLSNRYLYHFLGKFEGSGNNRRAGLHFFCDQADSSNRNNSYFVWFRLDDQKIQIYKVVNNVFGSPQVDLPLSFNAGQWYDIKIIYDRITGKMSVYMNNAPVANWTDTSPFNNGKYISFRSANCKFSVDEIKVYRSRGPNTNISIGPGNNYDIRYQNPNPTTNSAKIKSICQDSAGNLSAIYAHDLNIDWTAPSNQIFINDGYSGVDVSYNCSKDSMSAHWGPSLDSNSAIARYWYSIGTSIGATDVLNWTSNWGSTAVTAKNLNLSQWGIYYFNVRAEDGAGLYNIIISSNGQQVDTTCVLSGVGEFKVEGSNFKAIPNPFNSFFTVDCPPLVGEGGRIEVFNSIGQKVLENKIFAENTGMDMKEFSNGIYFLRITQNNKVLYTQKIIKE